MITRCVGLSPDGGLGCTRDARHDNRDFDMPCKNMSTGIVWCSRCDSFNCQHINVTEVLASLYMREARTAARTARDGAKVETDMLADDDRWLAVQPIPA